MSVSSTLNDVNGFDVTVTCKDIVKIRETEF